MAQMTETSISRGSRRSRPGPEISVVVATYNRAEGLERLIHALEDQQAAPPFEVIVVDDCSTDETHKKLFALPQAARLDLTLLRTGQNGGPAIARNIGWRAARGAAVAFTDDDCLPQPGWLAALARGLTKADLVQGRTIPNPNFELRALSHSVERVSEAGFYETCNIAYRRDVLESVDGFDEQFRAPFGEDTDLAWRAKSAGARTMFETEALVWHDVSPGSLKSKVRQLPREAGVVLAVRKHPGLRAHTQTPLFFKRSHPRALVLLAGLVLLARRPGSLRRWATAGTMAAPWLLYQSRIVDKREWRHALPRLFVLDIAQIAVLARASLRYRTLFL